MKTISLIVFSILLSACSSLPPAIEDAPLYDLSYKEASQNTAKFREAAIRWGGVIVEVDNEQNFSLMQVLYYPLNSYGRPMLDQPSEGRFVVKTSEFLESTIYTKNSEITVAGQLKGDIERTIGKKVMHLPLVSSSVMHIWPDYYNGYNGPYNYYYGGFGVGPYYPYGFYPYYWGGFYRPFPYYYPRR